MVLHVVFEHVPKTVPVNDMYFTTNRNAYDELQNLGCTNVKLKSISFKDDTGEFSEVSRAFFRQMPAELLNIENDVFSRMTQPILFVLSEIEAIANTYGITELRLYRGSNIRFLAAEKSEGESGGTWLYSRAWMFNSFIYEYFRDKTAVVWKEKESAFCIWTISHIRSFKLYHEAALGLLKDLRRKPVLKEMKISSNDEIILGTVWVNQQYQHLKGFLESSKKYKAVYVGRPSIIDDPYVRVFPLSVMNILETYKQTRTVVGKLKDVVIHYGKKDFLVRKSALKRAFRRTYLVYYANYLRYLNTISSLSDKYTIHAIINNKTWNWTQSIDGNISHRINAKHITLQSVMLPNVVYPNKNIFEKVFVSARQQYDLFKKAGIDVDLYSGYPISENVKWYESGDLVVSVFLQSDMYEEVSLQLIDQIVKQSFENRLIKIIIKPHYRQSNKTVERINNLIADNQSIMLSPPEDDANTIIKSSHFCVSFTSSVLFEAACCGITPVSVIMNDTMAEFVYTSEKLSDDAVLKYTTIESLFNNLNNPNALIARFEQTRMEYFSSLFGKEIGIDEIVQ